MRSWVYYHSTYTFQVSIHVNFFLHKVRQKNWATLNFFQEAGFISSNEILLFFCHFDKISSYKVQKSCWNVATNETILLIISISYIWREWWNEQFNGVSLSWVWPASVYLADTQASIRKTKWHRISKKKLIMKLICAYLHSYTAHGFNLLLMRTRLLTASAQNT